MMDLLNDGSIAIDFEAPPEGDGDPTSQRIIVKAPRTFGAYKRLRAEVDAANVKFSELSKTLREDDSITVAQMTSQLNANLEDAAISWWQFVINGDESFKGLGSAQVPDVEQWPVFLTSNESISAALTHWKSVPLARGGKLIPKT